jgi:hypothetical protein
MANDAPGNVTAAKNIRQIVVTAPGPQGASGLSGIQSSEIPTLVSYTHNRITPSAAWTVTHSLNFYPNVTVYNSAHEMVEGTINHINVTQLTILLSAPLSGKAYLS